MGQKPRDLTPTRSVLDFFGAELRTIRERRRMSMADLATALAYDPSQVGKVERAERRPTREFAAACDKALGTDGRLTRLWQLVDAQGHDTGEDHRTDRRSGAAAAATYPQAGSAAMRTTNGTADTGHDGDAAPVGWYRPPEWGRDQDMHRRELLRTVLSGSGIALTGQVLAAIEATRQDVDRILSAGTISSAKMSLIEEAVAEHAAAYTRTPPLPMLGGTVLDFLELRQLAVHRQPAAVQGKLSDAAARLATLAADALMKLGQLREARNWYRTARLAADDTGNLVLRARVRAQEGMLPYYYGDPNQTVHLAREAQAIACDTPCAATALAAAAEARALARLGRRDESETAMRHAQDLFERTAASSGDDAFSFPAQRLLFYLSGALTNLGETTRAADVQRQALDLYDQAFPIDPALLRLDQAIGLAEDDAVEDACHVAQDAFTAVGDEHRTTILLTRARDVITAIPQNHGHWPLSNS